MVSLDVRFNEEDRRAFDAQITRFQRDLGNAPEEAIRYGMIALLQSMRASTKQAPKRRKVRTSKTGRKVRVDLNRLFVAEGLDRATGGPKNIVIFAPDLATAKLHPKAKIRQWGLARSSWGWAMQELFGARSGARPGLARPSGAVETVKTIDRQSGNAECFVTNKLDYISKALVGGRGPAVQTAMARAAGTMKGRIERHINQATREAGY